MNHVLVKRLRELCFGETQLEVAKRLDSSVTNVNKWLNGRANPRVDTIIRICDEYEVSADWLLGLSDKK